jgi:hypothetical protein
VGTEVIETGGPFYEIARRSPFSALLRVHDRIWNDRENFTLDERDYSTGVIRFIGTGFAFRINERFRSQAKRERKS